MTFHRPDMLALEQNAMILRSGIAQINGILYLLDAGDDLCRVCRVGLLDLKLRPCGAIFRVIDGKLAALAAGAHGQKRFVSTLLQFQLQCAVIMAAYLLDTGTVPKYERKVVAARGDRHREPCIEVCCGERTVIRCKLHLDLLQDFDRTFCRNVHQCCHRFIKGCCVYGTSHAAFLLVFCKVARILTEPVANVICRTRVSPTVRML